MCNRDGCSKPCALNPRTGDGHRFCSLRCWHAQKREARRSDVTLTAPSTSAAGDEPENYADFQLDLLRAMEMSRMQFLREMGQLQTDSNAQRCVELRVAYVASTIMYMCGISLYSAPLSCESIYYLSIHPVLAFHVVSVFAATFAILFNINFHLFLFQSLLSCRCSD